MAKQPAGLKDAERALRSVLEFLQLDIASLSEPGCRQWRVQLERIIGGTDLYTLVPDDAESTRKLLRGVHHDAYYAVRLLLNGEPWQLPPTILYSHVQRGVAGKSGKVQPGLREYRLLPDPGEERPAIVNGIAHLVITAGARLRECARESCRRMFVARKHGIYCGHACQQREMNLAKTISRKAERAARRAAKHKGGK